jgi:2,3-bisphosphoglycerate-dependent phosphoglycerate mutase
MATSVFHQPPGTAQPHQHFQNSGFRHEFGHASVKLTFKGFKVETGLSRRGGYSSCKRKFGVIQASASHTSVVQPVSYPPNNSTDELRKKSSKHVSFFFPKLIFIKA